MMKGIVKGYTIIVDWSDEDECYVVSVPTLKGCVTHGDTLKKAVRQAEDAIDSWISVAKKYNDPIPEQDVK